MSPGLGKLVTEHMLESTPHLYQVECTLVSGQCAAVEATTFHIEASNTGAYQRIPDVCDYQTPDLRKTLHAFLRDGQPRLWTNFWTL
eukprot:1011108-Pelagomonas_calceolata.AAC.3